MVGTKFNEAADALVGYEEFAKRRAERTPTPPPAAPSGVASPCRYYFGQTCECGGRGLCLDVA